MLSFIIEVPLPRSFHASLTALPQHAAVTFLSPLANARGKLGVPKKWKRLRRYRLRISRPKAAAMNEVLPQVRMVEPGRLTKWHLYTIFYGMITTIDSAGRIVVPKALRQALELKPGQPLEIRLGDGRLEIDIVPAPLALKKRGKDVAAVPATELPTLTAEQVRETLERVRR